MELRVKLQHDLENGHEVLIVRKVGIVVFKVGFFVSVHGFMLHKDHLGILLEENELQRLLLGHLEGLADPGHGLEQVEVEHVIHLLLDVLVAVHLVVVG